MLEEILDETVRYLDKPIWKATEYLLTPDPSWWGTAYKTVGIVGALFGVPFAILGETIHFLSQNLRWYRKEYLFHESTAEKKNGTPDKFLSFNVCMFQGGLPISFGGVSPASVRMDQLAEFLKGQDADIVCLQEMAFDPATSLIKKIEDRYPYIYYRIGPNPFRMESALFFASKYELKNPPSFIPFSIPGMQRGIRRGFFVAELEGCFVITTHLDPHVERGEVRAQEIEAILDYMKSSQISKSEDKPIFLMGDLNIEPQDVKALVLLQQNFKNFKWQDIQNPTEENGTCLDNFPEIMRGSQYSPRWTVIDHILVDQVMEIIEKRIPMFKLDNLPRALSDHHAVVLTLTKAAGR